MYVLILPPWCLTFWLQGGMMVNILAANGSILYALLGSRWQLTDDSTYVTSAYICSCMCMVVVCVHLVTWKNIFLPRFVDCSCMYILLLYVHACIYTQWLCSLQSGGSISKWHSPVTLSVSDALCSWSGKQQNGELPEAGTVSGVVLIFPSWTLHVCYAYRDAVCCKSSCQHLTVLDQSSVSLVGLQATLGQSIYSKLASPRVMLHSLTDTGTPLRDWCQILSHNLWCGHVRVNVVIEYRLCVTM